MWSNIIYAMFFEIVLHELNLTYKAHGPPKFFCGPLGFNGRSVGNRASTVLVSRRVGLGQNPSCKYWSSSKCNALFSLDWVFCLCFYFDRHQKGGHFYQRGATAFWGAVAQTSPPGSATTKSLMRSILNVHAGHRFRAPALQRSLPSYIVFHRTLQNEKKEFHALTVYASGGQLVTDQEPHLLLCYRKEQ